MDALKLTGYILFSIYSLCSLWLLINGLVQLHLLWKYKKNRSRTVALQQLPDELPFVSIQVPVYNEKYVIERLLLALSRFDYPKEKFEIQVLDDSTDETSAIIDDVVLRLQQDSVKTQVLRRENRKGYKAGALQAGLATCKGDLIAIFDADFVPPPHFLKRMIPYFSNAHTGLVQARWTHLNKEENLLTRIQTFLLDTHFSVEQGGRFQAGYFINFCGTAGIWRKQCIEEAGGWDGAVLSEDLDLSYRAQLKGWKLHYAQEIEVPAELPAVIEAFKTQQFRWTKGMAQISRKMLRGLVRSTMPFDKKLHAVFHLLSSMVFVCLFINSILTVPMLLFRNLYPEFITLSHYTAVSSVNMIALTLFYYNGTRTETGGKKRAFFSKYPLFLVVYMGLCVQNTIAVLQGLWGTASVFVRTPKFAVTGRKQNTYLQKKFNWINALELAFLLYFMAGIVISTYLKDYFMIVFFLMTGYGLAYILIQSFTPFVALRRWKVA